MEKNAENGAIMKKKLQFAFILLLLAAAGAGICAAVAGWPAKQRPQGLSLSITDEAIRAECGGDAAVLDGREAALGSARLERLGEAAVKISYGDISILAVQDGAPPDVAATVLVADGDSLSPALLAAIWPGYAVVTGECPEDTLRLLDSVCRSVYQVRLQGAVALTTDGQQISFQTEREASSRELFPHRRNTSFSALQEGAEASRIYVLNLNSKVFHLPSCPSAGQMKAENRQLSTQPAAALLAGGYRPCGSCLS